MPFQARNFIGLLFLTIGAAAGAQTMTLNDGVVVNATPHQVGINFGGYGNYDSGQTSSNLLLPGGNPGFEPMLSRMIQPIPSTGTALSFTDENKYSGDVANSWDGATFIVTNSIAPGPELGCTGTIASNTGPNRFMITAGSYDATTKIATFTVPNNTLTTPGYTFQGYYFSGALSPLTGQTATVQAGSNGTTLVALYTTTSGVTTGTIPQNNYGQINGSTPYNPMVYTINPATNQGSSGCAGPFTAGDNIVVSKVTSPTPEAWWETGFYPGVNGPGGSSGGSPTDYQYLSLTTGLCATCGQQALQINVNNPSGYAQWNNNFDNNSNDIFTLLDTAVTGSGVFKTLTGSPILKLKLQRLSTNGIACAQQTFTPTTSWSAFTYNCAGTEVSIKDTNPSCVAGGTTTACTQQGIVYLYFDVYCLGGVPCSIGIDNVSLTRAEDTTSNTTNVKTQVIHDIANFSTGEFRFWNSNTNNCTTIDNWIAPQYAMMPCGLGSSNASYILDGQSPTSVYDWLEAMATAQTQKGSAMAVDLEIPIPMSVAEGQNFIDWLASPCSTTYGAKRCASGQTTPFTSVFPLLKLVLCNECWNANFVRQNLQGGGQPGSEVYYYYSAQIKPVIAAMRAQMLADSVTNIQFGMDVQTAIYATTPAAITRAQPDFIEIQSYIGHQVNSFATTANLWDWYVPDAYLIANGTGTANCANDKTNFACSMAQYTAAHNCGASGTAQCKVNVYEWGQGTIAGTLNQLDQNYINVGAGTGVVDVAKAILDQTNYAGVIESENYFALTEFENGGSNSNIALLWGIALDMGGATNNVRPQFVALAAHNKAIIGSQYQCTFDSTNLYTYPGSPNNGENVPPGIVSITNMPYLIAGCYSNGSQRSIEIVNTDLVNAHTVTFAGTNTPAGSVTVSLYNPASPNLMNEATTPNPSTQFAPTVRINSGTFASPLSIPAYSIAYISYSTGSTPTAATPTFSPVAGTYTGAQTVTLTSASGCSANIVWNTTNAQSGGNLTGTTTGTTVTVSTSETIYAQVQSCTGYLNSGIGSAAYTITVPAAVAPTFTPPAGMYSSAQSVVLSTATSGATLCYTVNGTTPTAPTQGTCGAGSTPYTSAVSVSVPLTMEALATKVGYTNSSVATAVYHIGTPTAATPTFAPAAGSYVGTITVSLSTATAGATIYYTTDGSTPTTSSAVYTAPLSVSATATVKAIAAAAGYTTSAVGSASYTITNPTFTCSVQGVSVTFSGSKVTLACPQ